eukprot:TRINITY_DN3270_c1_g1_i1.p1 TRINITY_DN3270_c1_g1~~TRINITY_DN3270_c1_g1_i1.p1  ORF type:complete len:300 (-),score=60.81 TRINITY_DN3270_c1_g1_i1:50-949(-)
MRLLAVCVLILGCVRGRLSVAHPPSGRNCELQEKEALARRREIQNTEKELKSEEKKIKAARKKIATFKDSVKIAKEKESAVVKSMNKLNKEKATAKLVEKREAAIVKRQLKKILKVSRAQNKALLSVCGKRKQKVGKVPVNSEATTSKSGRGAHGKAAKKGAKIAKTSSRKGAKPKGGKRSGGKKGPSGGEANLQEGGSSTAMRDSVYALISADQHAREAALASEKASRLDMRSRHTKSKGRRKQYKIAARRVARAAKQFAKEASLDARKAVRIARQVKKVSKKASRLASRAELNAAPN